MAGLLAWVARVGLAVRAVVVARVRGLAAVAWAAALVGRVAQVVVVACLVKACW